MATWTDKQLAGHKRAQSYISSAGATLGVAALGAASMKAKPVGRAVNRMALRHVARGGSMKTAGRLRQIPGKAANAATPLTTGSAGVGGVGGYNFAAIQSQESRRSRVKKNEVGTMDFGTPGARVGVNLETVSKRREEGDFAATRRDFKQKDSRNANLGHMGAQTALGAGLYGGYAGGSSLAAGGFINSRARKQGYVATPNQLKNVRSFGRKNAALFAGGAALATGGAVASQRYAQKLDAARQAQGRTTKPVSKPRRGVKKSLVPIEDVSKRRDEWKNISEHQRRAADARRTRKNGAQLATGAAGLGATLLYAGGGADAQKLIKAKNLRAIGRHPLGALTLGAAAATGVGAGMAISGGARNKHNNRKIAELRQKRARTVTKAYDPERNRGRRLEGYQTAANVGGGAAAALGIAGIRNTVRAADRTIPRFKTGPHAGSRNMDGARLGKIKPFAKPAGKAAGLTALGAGAIVAGDRINAYRKTKARPYRPLRTT